MAISWRSKKEIVAGVLVGPSVLDLVGTNETLVVLAEIGVIFQFSMVGGLKHRMESTDGISVE